MLFLRPSRHPLLFLLSVAFLLLGLLQWALFRPVAVPADYVGLWRNGPTTLEIRPEGVASWRTTEGYQSKVDGGQVTALDAHALTFRRFLLPRHLRIDAPPRHAYDDVWTMKVEGQELWRMP
jgi:hypothetical protein